MAILAVGPWCPCHHVDRQPLAEHVDRARAAHSREDIREEMITAAATAKAAEERAHPHA